MAKAKNTTVTKTVPKAQFVEMAANTSMDNADDVKALFAAAKNVHVDELAKVAGDVCIELEECETYVFICKGISPNALPKKNSTTGEMIDAVCLMREDMTEGINADIVLRSTIERETKNGRTWPRMIMVHVKGMKKSSAGEYKDLEIYVY